MIVNRAYVRYFVLALVLAFASSRAAAQGACAGDIAVQPANTAFGTVIKPVASPLVSVCRVSGGTCTAENLYSDIALTTSLGTSGTFNGDANGNYRFCTSGAGTFQVTVSGVGIVTYTYNLSIAGDGTSFVTWNGLVFANRYGSTGTAVDSALAAAGTAGVVIKTSLFTTTADPSLATWPTRAGLYDFSGQRSLVGIDTARFVSGLYAMQTDLPDAYPNLFGLQRFWFDTTAGQNTAAAKSTFTPVSINARKSGAGQFEALFMPIDCAGYGDCFGIGIEQRVWGLNVVNGDEGSRGLKIALRQQGGGLALASFTVTGVSSAAGLTTLTTSVPSGNWWNSRIQVGNGMLACATNAGKTATVTISSIAGTPPVVTITAALSAAMQTAGNANGLCFVSDADTTSGNQVWYQVASVGGGGTTITLNTTALGASKAYPGNSSTPTTGTVAFGSQIDLTNTPLVQTGTLTGTMRVIDGYTGWVANDTFIVPNGWYQDRVPLYISDQAVSPNAGSHDSIEINGSSFLQRILNVIAGQYNYGFRFGNSWCDFHTNACDNTTTIFNEFVTSPPKTINKYNVSPSNNITFLHDFVDGAQRSQFAYGNVTGGGPYYAFQNSLITNQFFFSALNGQTALTQGAVTGASAIPALLITPTWNNAATIQQGIRLNVTDTASAASSTLVDLQVGGSSKFSVSKAGVIFVASTAQATNLNANFVNGLSILSTTDSPGAITVNASTCTDRDVVLAAVTAAGVTTVTANYALESNLSLSSGQNTVGHAHYRICNVSVGNITLAAASTFNIKVIQ